MDIFSGLSLLFGVGKTIFSIFGDSKKAEAEKKAAEAKNKANAYNARVHDANADYLEQAAVEVGAKGERDTEKFGESVRRFYGTQEAQQASTGAVVGEGSYGKILADTTKSGYEDQQQIRENYRKQQADLNRKASFERGRASLLRQGGDYEAPGAALSIIGDFAVGASHFAKDLVKALEDK